MLRQLLWGDVLMINLQELADILICPKCQGKVLLLNDKSAFVCRSCNLKYPVDDSIPVMLIDCAEKCIEEK